MRKKIIVFLMGLILAGGLTTTALAGDKSIADLESNPSKYTNKTVKVVGVVRDADGVNIPILGIRGGCYKLDDGPPGDAGGAGKERLTPCNSLASVPQS